MPAKALKFISSRPKATAQIEKRVIAILWYTIECYQILLKTETDYSKSKIRATSKIGLEDYLKIDLIEKFLIPNKYLLKALISELEDITFEYETQKRYLNASNGMQQVDKIDIYINKLGLKSLLSMPDEQVYFVIECKRIEILSDSTKYIVDIEKSTQRNYGKARLPFEGQIAFIENSKLTHTKVQAEINARLKTNTSIKTQQDLKKVTLHKSFNGSYYSKHKKSFAPNRVFTVYHLLFDYSGVITA